MGQDGTKDQRTQEFEKVWLHTITLSIQLSIPQSNWELFDDSQMVPQEMFFREGEEASYVAELFDAIQEEWDLIDLKTG